MIKYIFIYLFSDLLAAPIPNGPNFGRKAHKGGNFPPRAKAPREEAEWATKGP